jgi:hypothetical protein
MHLSFPAFTLKVHTSHPSLLNHATMLHADESLHVCVILSITKTDVRITSLSGAFCQIPYFTENTIWDTSLQTVISAAGKTTPVLKVPNSVALVRKRTNRPSNRRLSAKLVTNLADRGCRVVSATNAHGR